ncbi:hypothetical protein BaRGS_00022063 [Batillaria attramentaria]|uniref:Uncharacterized protein n=1 Tax=Batillaria attramentaria TaxID=370345 RepID=A0ABD0KI00_9CAEN
MKSDVYGISDRCTSGTCMCSFGKDMKAMSKVLRSPLRERMNFCVKTFRTPLQCKRTKETVPNWHAKDVHVDREKKTGHAD